MQTRVIALFTPDLIVDHATEYNEVGSKAPKHPHVVLKHTTSTQHFMITDRYVLFNLLKKCDPELKYDEFMQTVYDIPVGFEDRPSLVDMIQGYIDHSKVNGNLTIDVQTRDVGSNVAHIIEVYGNIVYGHYFHTTFDFIDANMLHDYEKAGVMKTEVDGVTYPMMTFVKTIAESWDEGGVSFASMKMTRFIINILSKRNRTLISGVVEYTNVNDKGESSYIQPDLVTEIQGWVHTIDAGLLQISLSRVDESLQRFVDDVNVTRKALSTKTGSTRLKNFYAKSNLQREHYRELLRESK